jgi:hypothetical protein
LAAQTMHVPGPPYRKAGWWPANIDATSDAPLPKCRGIDP